MKPLASWEILDLCIPRGTRRQMGQAVNKSAERINFWHRPPKPKRIEFDEDGQKIKEDPPILNPIDQMDRIQDHAFAHAPDRVHLIDEHFKRRRIEHFKKMGIEIESLEADSSIKEKTKAQMTYIELVELILLKFPAHEIRAKWNEAKEYITVRNDPELQVAEQEVEKWVQRIEALHDFSAVVKRVK